MNNLKTVALLSFMSALVWFIGIAMFGSRYRFLHRSPARRWSQLLRLFFLGQDGAAGKQSAAGRGARAPRGLQHRQTTCTATAEMPMPKIYLIDSPQPNAFATGRNPSHAAVAVTTGIMQALTREELEGVLGHELSHVKNRDILISSVAAMMAAALSIFARMAFWFGGGRGRGNALSGIITVAALIIAPVAGMIIRMAISRSREYEADASGAAMTGAPLNLASALEKIGAGTARVPMQVDPAVSQLFIDDPLKAFGARDRRGGGRLRKLFSTHPPVEERIKRLTDMYYNV